MTIYLSLSESSQMPCNVTSSHRTIGPLNDTIIRYWGIQAMIFHAGSSHCNYIVYHSSGALTIYLRSPLYTVIGIGQMFCMQSEAYAVSIISIYHYQARHSLASPWSDCCSNRKIWQSRFSPDYSNINSIRIELLSGRLLMRTLTLSERDFLSSVTINFYLYQDDFIALSIRLVRVRLETSISILSWRIRRDLHT